MNKDYQQRFTSIVRSIYSARGKMPEGTIIQSWWIALKDETESEFEEAAGIMMRSSDEFPNPGKLIDIINAKKREGTPNGVLSLPLPVQQTCNLNPNGVPPIGKWSWDDTHCTIGGVEMTKSEQKCPRCGIHRLTIVNGKTITPCADCLTALAHLETSRIDMGEAVKITTYFGYYEQARWQLPSMREVEVSVYPKKKEKKSGVKFPRFAE